MNFQSAVFERSYGLGSQLPPSDGAEIVFCGRSNVGKSSLINKLCMQKALARVSGTPGKTTTINSFLLNGGVRLVDLPGYGYAKRPRAEIVRWAELLETYFTSGRNIALAVILLDARRTPGSDDAVMLEHLCSSKTPFVAVMTKTDKLNKTEYAEAVSLISGTVSDYGGIETIPFSSLNFQDAAALQKRISEITGL